MENQIYHPLNITSKRRSYEKEKNGLLRLSSQLEASRVENC